MLYYGYGYVMDPTILLVLIGAGLSMLASSMVKSTYNRYAKVNGRCGMTGAEAALQILKSQGIYDVTIRPVAGELTDHYNPADKTLNLSEPVYSATSISAIGVAAHECGHAIQDNQGYIPLKIRGAFVPIANFGAGISWPLILIGLLLGGMGSLLVQIGVFVFSFAVLFQIITLPVELNASSRALKILSGEAILSGDEVNEAGKVLKAAALTYVAATAASILQLLRLVILFGGRRNRE